VNAGQTESVVTSS